MTKRRWLLLITAILSTAVIIASSEVLLPIVLALVLAYVLMPAVRRLEARGIRRGVAILSLYGLLIGSFYLFGALAAPRIRHETIALSHELPKLARALQNEVIPNWQARLHELTNGVDAPPPAASASSAATETSAAPMPHAGSAPTGAHDEASEEDRRAAIHVIPREDDGYDIEIGTGIELRPDDDDGWRVEAIDPTQKKTGLARALAYAEHNAIHLLRNGIAFFSSLARGIFIFFMTMMLAAYLMITEEQIYGFFRSLCLPPARPDFDSLVERVDRGLSGVVRGQLLICLINGVLTAVGYALIGLKYWPVMALLASVASLIPIFGVIFSSVPAVAVGLTQAPSTALFVLGWIVVIHQIEANVLNPKIIGTQAHLHPVLIVFSLLAGEHFFHAAGALLAVPVLSMAQSLFLHFWTLAERDEPALIVPGEVPAPIGAPPSMPPNVP